MYITILIDNESWIKPYGVKLYNEIIKLEHICNFVSKHSDVSGGDILFMLGCTKIFNNLHLNKHNIVIHESELPKGKGWSPLTYQILEGKNEIPITLFEAVKEMDAGDIYITDYISLTGYELYDEIKNKQGLKTIELALRFINNINKLKKVKQMGESTFYKRRTPIDSELDINKTISEQFNLLRVCSNDLYPAFIIINNNKYYLKIYKDK